MFLLHIVGRCDPINNRDADKVESSSEGIEKSCGNLAGKAKEMIRELKHDDQKRHV